MSVERHTAGVVYRDSNHRYWSGARELVGVTRVLDAVGITDFSAPWFTEWHKRRGQLVHAMVKLENDGILDEALLDDALVGFLVGYRKFRAIEGGEVEFCEQIVYDLDLGAAGTLDLIIRHPDDHPRRRRLYDVKPSLSPATAIQTAGYARFARALYTETMLFSRHSLALPGDGTYTTHPHEEPHDDMVFTAALRVAHWRVAHARW